MPRNHKKRDDTFSLINLSQFTRLRQDKQKIVNSPFEQNWKKAIVMEELLHLHKKDQNTQSSSPNYSKQQYMTWAGTYGMLQNDQGPWDNNEDHQIRRYQKMYDGLNKWEQEFQTVNIGKMMQNYNGRVKNKLRTVGTVRNIDNTKEKLKKNKFSKTTKDIKNNAFGSFYQCIKPDTKYLCSKRQQVQKLKNQAIIKYGVNFNKNIPQQSINVDYETFKKRDEEIFEQFASSLKNSRIIQDKSHQTSTRQSHRDDNDKIDLRMFGRTITNEIKIIPRAKTVQRKRYIRIVC